MTFFRIYKPKAIYVCKYFYAYSDRRPLRATESHDMSGGGGVEPNYQEQVACQALSDAEGMRQSRGDPKLSIPLLISCQWSPRACVRQNDAASVEDLSSFNSHGSAESESGRFSDTFDAAREQESLDWQVRVMCSRTLSSRHVNKNL